MQSKSLQACHVSPTGGQSACTAPMSCGKQICTRPLPRRAAQLAMHIYAKNGEPSLTGQIVLVQGKSLQACHNSPAGGQRACTAPTLWSWHFEWVFRSAWLPSNHASEVCRIAALTGQIGLVQSESLQTHHLRPARG